MHKEFLTNLKMFFFVDDAMPSTTTPTDKTADVVTTTPPSFSKHRYDKISY